MSARPIPDDELAAYCTVRGCCRETAANGYCSTHYNRLRRNGHTDGPLLPKGDPFEGVHPTVDMKKVGDIWYRRPIGTAEWETMDQHGAWVTAH